MSKFNIEDTVVCLPGFIGGDFTSSGSNYAGYGYCENSILTISKITPNESAYPEKGPVYWFRDHDGGVYESFLISYREFLSDRHKPWIGSRLLFKFV